MSDESKITVLKNGASDIIQRRSQDAREAKRRRELKKIKDELLTLARRVEELEAEEAA